MNKRLFLCNTVYQLIVAIEMKLGILEDFPADVVITDTLKNCDLISKRLSQLQMFDNVYSIKLNDDIEYSKIPAQLRKNKIILYLKSQSCQIFLEKYQEYFFSNVAGIGPVLGEFLKHLNPMMELSMFEDGIGAYSEELFQNFQKRIHSHNVLKRFYFKLFPHAMSIIRKYYVSIPGLLDWNIPNGAEVVKIVGPSNKEILKNALNYVFSYDKQGEQYEGKCIIIEESYHHEKCKVEDEDLFKEISNIIGNKNILIKRHPREKINRFEKYEIEENTDKSIPWEIILLNAKLTKSVIVTITSTVAFTSMLLDEAICSRTILLYKLIKSEDSRFLGFKKVLEQMVADNRYGFLIPENFDELKWDLKNLLISNPSGDA